MGKILIGMICDGKAGGIDKYILNFYQTVRNEECSIDFLTNKKNPELEKMLRENGSKLYEVPSLMHPIRQYQAVKTLIKNNAYDNVYMNISTALTFPALKAAYDCNVWKVIVHSHTSAVDERNPLKRCILTILHHMLKGQVCRYSNKYLACSDEAAEWMFSSKIIEEKKYEVIFNTVDTTKFRYDQAKRESIREELGLKDNFVIGNVGNICYQKNQLFLIDVFHRLLQKDSSAKLVIIGDGELLPQIKERIAKYRIEEHVLLLGRVDVSRGYMNAFDVFAFPSNFEGLGIVLIEAQCTKVPCIASVNVPKIAKVSNMFTFLPLVQEQWVETILSYKNAKKDEFVLDSLDKLSLEKQEEILRGIIDKD